MCFLFFHILHHILSYTTLLICIIHLTIQTIWIWNVWISLTHFFSCLFTVKFPSLYLGSPIFSLIHSSQMVSHPVLMCRLVSMYQCTNHVPMISTSLNPVPSLDLSPSSLTFRTILSWFSSYFSGFPFSVFFADSSSYSRPLNVGPSKVQLVACFSSGSTLTPLGILYRLMSLNTAHTLTLPQCTSPAHLVV